MLIWYLKELSNAKDRKTFRINVEFDHAYKLVWSPDSKAILVFKAMENTIEVYRVEKKDGVFVSSSKAFTFPKAHDNDVVSFGISNSGKFIISCTNRTDLILWDTRGNILEQLDTFLMSTYAVKISPCSRFIAACKCAWSFLEILIPHLILLTILNFTIQVGLRLTLSCGKLNLPKLETMIK